MDIDIVFNIQLKEPILIQLFTKVCITDSCTYICACACICVVCFNEGQRHKVLEEQYKYADRVIEYNL